ncbi:MAG: T9SS type A sorting domain-containing protein, partial [Bacteroidota bacterium]
PYVWTGSIGTNWNATGNWSCPLLPTSTSNVNIPVTSNAPIVTDAQMANNITIQTGATLSLNVTAQFSLYGNMTNNGTFTNNSAQLIYVGSAVQTMNSGTYTKVQINNAAGVNLGGNVTINDSLILVSGKLNLGSNNLTLGNASYASSGTATSYVTTNGIGKLTINNIGSTGKTGNVIFPIGNSTFNPAILLNSGTTDNFTANIIDSVTSSYSGTIPTGVKILSNAVNRSWIITEGTNGGSNVTIRLQWSASDELTSFTRANSYLSTFNGISWCSTSISTAVGTNPYSQTRSGISSFSAFGVGSNGTLPVTLINFSGVRNGKSVELTWTTVSELNNDHFEMERSIDNKLFEKISNVKGNGTTQDVHVYELLDDVSGLMQQKNPVVYYRLKQIDVNGKTTDAGTVAVNISNAMIGNISATAEPNPFRNNLNVKVNVSVDEHVIVRMIDISGRLISEQTNNVTTGDNTIELKDTDQLRDGIYLIYLISSQGTITIKVVKQN